MGRIITGIVVVFSLASAALAQELSPSPTPTPVTEPTPSVTNGAPSPPPASTFSPGLLGGKEPELDAEEREGVEITAAWRQKAMSQWCPRPERATR